MSAIVVLAIFKVGILTRRLVKQNRVGKMNPKILFFTNFKIKAILTRA